MEATAAPIRGLRLPVSTFDAEFVQTFTPGIEVVKDRHPTTLTVAGGRGHLHLRGAKHRRRAARRSGRADLRRHLFARARILSGDEDADGLLDTATSIFEDSLDEVWLFECRTTVNETTTNTVLVEGTPTDPLGEHLCDDVAEPGDDVAVLAVTTCDPTDQDVATVTIVLPLPPTGGQVMWPLLALGTLLLLIGAIAFTKARRRPAGP